ncbi:DinB family protein [Streptomyces sp. CRN 30]|uniref:DinB family protein n=1 Tax=Streptomyces sp. CRN 30 TaxID=3075613 RepID=UPI002A83BD7B|nr:DinB family protein [Streptomyces sp. CRN 30]
MVTHVSPEAHGDERGALLAFLAEQRGGIRRTLLGLTEEQAASRPSVSELSLAGLLKHVIEVEQGWVAMAKDERPAVERERSDLLGSFRLEADDTVEALLAYGEEVAAATEEFFRTVPSLDDTFPLPEAPWFPPGERVSMRWLGLHLIRETARHAGHADIVRESLDGATAFALVAKEQGTSWG